MIRLLSKKLQHISAAVLGLFILYIPSALSAWAIAYLEPPGSTDGHQ